MEKDKLIKLIFNLYKDEVVSVQKFRKEISKKYKLSEYRNNQHICQK